jgi:hypothetical protein
MNTKVGNPTGSGNPPGEHSDSYLVPGEGSGESHFNQNASYRSGGHVGINSKASDVGNQPEGEKSEDITKRVHGPALP